MNLKNTVDNAISAASLETIAASGIFRSILCSLPL